MFNLSNSKAVSVLYSLRAQSIVVCRKYWLLV